MVEGSGYSLREALVFEKNITSNWIHDFTFGCLSGHDTDVPLSNVFGYQNDGFDHITPDDILKVDDKSYAVIEYATSRNSSEEHLKKVFSIKRGSYEEALLNRSSSGSVNFFIMIATRSGIYTNLLNIDIYTIDEICLRYRLALEVYNELVSLGIAKDERREELSKNEKELTAILNNLEISEEDLVDYRPFCMDLIVDSEELTKSERTYVKKLTTNSINLVRARLESEVKKNIKKEDVGFVKNDGRALCKLNKERKVYEGIMISNLHARTQKQIDSFKIECNTAPRRSTHDNKAIITVPFIQKQPCEFNSDELLKIRVSVRGLTNTYEKIYLKGVDTLLNSCVSFIGKIDLTSVDEIHEVVSKYEEEKVPLARVKKNKSYKNFRFQVDLDEEEWIDLATRGINGLKYSNHPVVRQASDMKTIPFSLETEVGDVDDIMKNAGWFFEHFGTLSNDTKRVLDSFRQSSGLHNNDELSNKILSFGETLLSSRLGVFCSIMTEVSQELACHLRCNMNNNEFDIKRLKDRDIYIILHTTNSRSHLFFSLVWLAEENYNQMEGSVFGKVYTTSDGRVKYTDFLSVTESKVVNWAKAESTLLTMASYWCDFYSMEPWLFGRDSALSEEIKRMTLFSVLFSLHDKRQCEEPITLTRFILMESYVKLPSLPDPAKMLKKFSKYPRSRLEVWLVNRILRLISRIASGRFSYEEKIIEKRKEGGSLVTKRWRNLVNWITDFPLNNPDQQISLFYLGYLKNKEEQGFDNNLSKLYVKILEWEDNKPKSFDNLGMGDPPLSLEEKHEFSSTFVRYLSKRAKSVIKKKLGNKSDEILSSEIKSCLAKIDLESFCTLKASSNFGPEWYQIKTLKDIQVNMRILESAEENNLSLEEVRESKEKIKENLRRSSKSTGVAPTRSKVIQNLMSIIDREVNLYELIPLAIQETSKSKGMNIDLFKKIQYGLREIYVMSIYDRILQLCIETISRHLCSYFDNETMTHPQNKFNLVIEHGKKSKELLGADFKTYTTSDDAEKWNQGHFVTKFSIMLTAMTPKEFHPLVMLTLRLWMRKRIMIDPKLMEIILKNPGSPHYDEQFDKLRRAVTGKEAFSWYTYGTTYIQTQTGMMQGILHYTSSLFHSIFLDYLTEQIHKIKTRLKDPWSGNLVVTHMQSSDDSSLMISARASGKKLTDLQMFTRSCFFLKDILAKHIGIYRSAKSTSQLENVMEFNSEFFFGGNLYRPTLRWVASCCSVSEQECLASRQEEMSSLLTSVLEGGGSFFLCSLIQLGQCLLHYSLLGKGVSKYFSTYMYLLSKNPDPSCGYFLADNPVCSGLTGFNYNLWNCCRKTTLGNQFKLALMDLSSFDRRKSEEILNTTQNGSIVHSTSIRWGNLQKWKRLVTSLRIPEDWREKIDENPRLLYERPRDKEGLTLKLASKMHAPGVKQAVSKGNALARVISSSVYILMESVLSTEGGDGISKHSTMGLLVKNLIRERGEEAYLSEEDFKNLFPFNNDYNDLTKDLEKFSRIIYIPSNERPKKNKTKLQVTEGDFSYVMKPEGLVKWRWFGIDHLAASTRIKEEYWAALKATFTWLKDTHEETLRSDNLPFRHHYQIQNFLSRLDRKKRVVNLSGSPVTSKNGRVNLLNAIRSDFFPGLRVEPAEDAREEDNQELNTLRSKVRMIVKGPYSKETKITMLQESLHLAKNLGFLPGSRSRLNNLALLKKFLETEDNEKGRTKFLEEISKAKLGIFGFYTQPQMVKTDQASRGKHYSGKGIWRGSIDDKSIRLHIRDHEGVQQLNLIEISSMKNLKESIRLIKALCKEMNIENSYNTEKISFDSDCLIGEIKNFEIVQRGPNNCPIILNKSRELSVIEIASRCKMYLDIRNSTISIKAKSYDRTHTVLSYLSRDTDINMKGVVKMKTTPSKEWINWKPLDKSIVGIVVSSMRKDKRFSFQTDDGNIFEKLIKGYMSRKSNSVVVSNPLKTDDGVNSSESNETFSSDGYSSDEIWDCDSDSETGCIEAMRKELEKEANEEKDDDYIIDDTFGDIGDDFGDIIGYRNVEGSYDWIYENHPLLDSWLDSVRRRFGIESLSELLNNRVFLKGMEEDVEIISQIKCENPSLYRKKEALERGEWFSLG